jgi:hypothetical protein
MTMPNADRQVQELLDKQAIYEAMMRYCRGVDRCDEDLIKSAYHPDAYDDHGPFKGNAWEFAAMLVPAFRQQYTATMHNICNVLIEVDGDAADAESSFIAYQQAEGDGTIRLETIGGRYIDRFERRDGEWRIARRTVILEVSKVETVDTPYPLVDAFERGRQSRDDLVYRGATAPS